MRPDAIRDWAGRQYPAHLDPWVPPRTSGPVPRWRTPPRPLPPLNYQRRPGRDVERRRHGTRLYHPGPEDVAALRQRERDLQGCRPPLSVEPTDLPECSCPIECEAACLGDCPVSASRRSECSERFRAALR